MATPHPGREVVALLDYDAHPVRRGASQSRRVRTNLRCLASRRGSDRSGAAARVLCHALRGGRVDDLPPEGSVSLEFLCRVHGSFARLERSDKHLAFFFAAGCEEEEFLDGHSKFSPGRATVWNQTVRGRDTA